MTRRAWLPWALVAGYLAVCTFAAVQEARGAPAPVLCLFRWTTGLPCPTCGATRATLAFATGHVSEALRLNPLIAAAWLLSPVLAAALLVWRKRRPSLDPHVAVRLRRVGFSLLVLALLVNWLYLLAHLPRS